MKNISTSTKTALLTAALSSAVSSITLADSGFVFGHPELGLVQAIAASNYHYAAVRADGQVVCWGSNEHGQCDVPSNLGPCVSVAANGQGGSSGPGFTLALRTDGGVVAWGYNGAGQCSVPSDLGPCRQIAAGFKNTLVLKSDGHLAAWGQAEFGQCGVPSNTCTRIAAGNYHGLALTLAGQVLQWGQCQPVPSNLGTCIDVAGGLTFSVALRSDGSVAQWGTWGNTPPETNGRCIAVSCSDYGVFAIRESHTVVSWLPNGPLIDHSGVGPCLAVVGGYNKDFVAILAIDKDSDSDGLFDQIDNCPTVYNPTQTDCNTDGIGDACEIAAGAPDFNHDTIPDTCQCLADLVLADHQVNGADLGALLSQWGPANGGTISDINRDGLVNGADLGYLLANWGPCPN